MVRSLRDRCRPEHVDAGEEEQPDHVDEMPVPGGCLEAEMARRSELSCDRSEEANREEDRADDHMKAVKTGGHEERRAIDGSEVTGAIEIGVCSIRQLRDLGSVETESEWCVAIFVRLDAGEGRPQEHGEQQA